MSTARLQKNRINILIIEDNIGDARLITELLKETQIKDYEITYLDDLSEIHEITSVAFDILLLDLHLSELPPIETFKLVNQVFPKVPIIILTGVEDDDLATRVVRLGAQDYLVKGTFDANTLKRSIQYAIERKKSQLRLMRARKRSRRMEAHASLLEDETKRLEKLNKSKDVFLSIASHQLRTPATSVKQYLGMLLEGYKGPLMKEQKSFIETAYQSNERQLKIIDDLLKVAKLDAGYVKLRKQFVQLNKLLQQVIDDQIQTFVSRDQKVYFTPLEPDEKVLIDESNMRMVFENILNNAGKYSPNNSRIDVNLKRRQNSILVEIKDTGIGISHEDIGKLFQKFSRIDNSFAYAPNGSGLGLYWANEIAKLHGGSIRLKTAPGKGSAFTIVIPHKAVHARYCSDAVTPIKQPSLIQ